MITSGWAIFGLEQGLPSAWWKYAETAPIMSISPILLSFLLWCGLFLLMTNAIAHTVYLSTNAEYAVSPGHAQWTDIQDLRLAPSLSLGPDQSPECPPSSWNPAGVRAVKNSTTICAQARYKILLWADLLPKLQDYIRWGSMPSLKGSKETGIGWCDNVSGYVRFELPLPLILLIV